MTHWTNSLIEVDHAYFSFYVPNSYEEFWRDDMQGGNTLVFQVGHWTQGWIWDLECPRHAPILAARDTSPNHRCSCGLRQNSTGCGNPCVGGTAGSDCVVCGAPNDSSRCDSLRRRTGLIPALAPPPYSPRLVQRDAAAERLRWDRIGARMRQARSGSHVLSRGMLPHRPGQRTEAMQARQWTAWRPSRSGVTWRWRSRRGPLNLESPAVDAWVGPGSLTM